VLAEALLYAVDPDGDPNTNDGAQIINLSLGTATRTRIFDSIAQIATCSIDNDPVNDLSDPGYDADEARCNRSRGVVIVAAAGNDGSASALEYPAAESSQRLASVGASAPASRLASFSNYGSWVHFVAPGDHITSSVPGGGYGTWSGTSMAAPLYAGTAALLRSINPTMKPEDILRRIGSRSAALCGTNLRQIDANAALRDVNAPAISCH
jgi:subtilisin family serine protease